MASVSAIALQARKDYESAEWEQQPETLWRILGGMKLALANVRQEALSVDEGSESWFRAYKFFELRLRDYQVILESYTGRASVTKAINHHKLRGHKDMPKAYQELVVRPILFGNAASCIQVQQQPHCSVGATPDVATPLVLGAALKKVKSRADSILMNALYTIYEANKPEVDEFVAGMAEDLSEIGKLKVDEKLPEILETGKDIIQQQAVIGAKKGVGPALILVGGVALLAFMKK